MLDVSGAGGWDGSTYYGREQVKAAPFNNWLVGSYIFAAGLSGGAAVLSAVMDLVRGDAAEPIVRRGRWLSLLGPTLGTACLIADLHTPKRFYNMLRLFKVTSPMSIGSWILVVFGLFSSATAAGDVLARLPGLRWLRDAAKAVQIPAAVTGAGLATYTASLLSATSTPLWAAAPGATAVRFGSSSVASAAATLSLGQGRTRLGRDLDSIALAALALELAGTISADQSYHQTGVANAMQTTPGRVEELGATVLGVLVPIGLLSASLGLGRPRSRSLSAMAGVAILAGSATLRIAFMAAGDCSARRADISMRFAQPENLPRMRGWPIQHRH
ncbi:MAG TPA: NrfD/PsrC family molybdoenzyme membrane anchor subunit [Acetobacteraceae bacterium]|nr:NrfD/PsrC family molybdoenzyme membrane anchor subunit [Acetobacteraceae bacterium]